MTERESLIALGMLEGIGPVTVKRLIAAFGSAAASLEAPPSVLRSVAGIGPETARLIGGAGGSVDAAAETARLEKRGFGIVTLADPAYPESLREIYDPPPLLYVSGELRIADRHAIAIVGARRCSSYGRIVAGRLAEDLARAGLTVVSGLARGIDSAAHRGALDTAGRTIAVLGSGPDIIYPPENRGLANEISRSGAVISEFPPGTKPARGNFPFRNRVISGISLGVIVVEAAERSGSLITARMALDQGRTVFAVPGRIDSFSSRGTNSLIAQGATIVRAAGDVFEEFPYLFPEDGEGDPGVNTRPRPKLTPLEKRVIDVLSAEERGIDMITELCRLSPSVVAATLLSLELKHLVIQLPGKLFRIIH